MRNKYLIYIFMGGLKNALFQSALMLIPLYLVFSPGYVLAQDGGPAAADIVKSGGISFSSHSRSVVTISKDNNIKIIDLSNNEIVSFKAHKGTVLQAVFSPDGSMVATASVDGEVSLWRTNGDSVAEMKGHSGAVQGLLFSADGTSLYSCSNDGTVRRWNLKGKQVTQFNGHSGAVYAIALSSDGRYLYSGSQDRTLKVWNPDGSMEKTITGFGGSIYSVAVRQDGMCAAGTSDNKIRMITSDGKLINEIQETSPVCAVRFLPDGRAVLSGMYDGDINLRDLSGKIIRTFKGGKDPVYNFAVNSDGRMIAVGSADGVRFWTSGWRLHHEIGKHDGDAYGVAVSPDQRYIASGGADNTIRIWTFNGRYFNTMKTDGAVRSLSFSPDGEYLLSCSDDRKIRLWKKNGSLIAEYDGYSYFDKSLSWHPDGKSFVFCSENDTAEIRNTNGAITAVLKGTGSLNTVAFSPDGKMIAAGGRAVLTVFTPEGKLIRAIPVRSGIQDLSWSPDSTMIAVGAQDVEVWGIDGKNIMNSGVHRSSVFTVAFSPDGRSIASGTCDHNIFISSLDGTVISRMKHQSHVHSVHFSPDGKYLASNSWDSTVKLWTFRGDAVSKVEDNYLDDEYTTKAVPRYSFAFRSCSDFMKRNSAWYLWVPLMYMGTSAGLYEYGGNKISYTGGFVKTNATAGSFFLGGFLWMKVYETLFTNPYSYSRGFGRNFWDTVIILGGSAACGYLGYHFSPEFKNNRALYYGSAAAVVTIPFMVYSIRF